MNTPELNRPEPKDSKRAEKTPTRSLEILNYDHASMLVNHESPDSMFAYRLADAWRDGLPDGWQPLGVEATKHTNVWVGECGGRWWLAKLKQHIMETDEQLAALGVKRGELSEREQKRVNANNSFVSELTLAPKIRRVIDDPALQAEIMTDFPTVTSLKYVEPLLGVAMNVRDSSDKYVIYPMIDDAWAVDAPNRPDDLQIDYLDGTSISLRLRTALAEAGIDADDLDASQLLEDLDGGLYLIDAEGYTA
jgi:hypothetical protein